MGLIILSDLLGNQDVYCVKTYLKILENTFKVQFYNSCLSAEIDTEINDKTQIHKQFIEGGIKRAIKNLLLKEKEGITIIGFSIGGLIAWKAALLGLNTNYICAVSSTRLRYESRKPNATIDLLFAENDPFKPEKNGLKQKKSVLQFSNFIENKF